MSLKKARISSFRKNTWNTFYGFLKHKTFNQIIELHQISHFTSEKSTKYGKLLLSEISKYKTFVYN